MRRTGDGPQRPDSHPRSTAVLGCLFLATFLAVTFWGFVVRPARAQDANTPLAPAASITAETGRAVVPMQPAPTATDPGTEGEVRITTHKIFTFHLGSWGWSPRFPMPTQTPATPDTPNTP